MNLNQIRLVYLKEMTDIIRDKRIRGWGIW